MIRRSHILTAAAILAVAAAPAYGDPAPWENLRTPANAAQDLRTPDAVDAAEHRGLYATGSTSDSYVLERDYGSPDVVDAARDLPPVQVPAPAVAAAEPSNGFDWGDAGIGAAGMLALFSIAAGSALLLAGRRRRGGFRAATH